MRVISYRRLREFYEEHPGAKEPLDAWYKKAKRAKWQNISDVKLEYPHADAVGKCTVFNIGGNKYRLITGIVYARQTIYIKDVLTHKEYTAGNKDKKGTWYSACK